jgi:GDPmannose 4,6-dehydratase
MAPKALITGITGQDGSYLAELLLSKGYEVHGLVRRSSSLNTTRIEKLVTDRSLLDSRFFLHVGDLSDTPCLYQVLRDVRPDEIYNLGAQSHVRASFDMPEYTADTTATGAIRLLDAIVRSGIRARYYQASSSEMFGKVQSWPQNERTPFYPRSPYAVSKVFAFWATVNYREAYGLHASNGILFNHESPRRGEEFVTRKITQAVAAIAAGKQDKLVLGNLDATRDWGFAGDYVEAMWLMLQQPEGDDYVVATGETHSIREFLDEAFGFVGLDWKDYVVTDAKFLRPTEVDRVVGDFTKARDRLGWRPKIPFRELVAMMVAADLRAAGVDPASFAAPARRAA